MTSEIKLRLAPLLGLSPQVTEGEFDVCLAALGTWDKAVFYDRVLLDGYLPSLRKLSEIFQDKVWLYLKLARMTPPVLDAFPARTSIQFRWIKKLDLVLHRDPDIVLNAAKQITALRAAGEKWPAARVYKQLTSGPPTLLNT